MYEEAIRDTIARFEATGSPVITDGEQRKYHNFWTYSVHVLPNTAPDVYIAMAGERDPAGALAIIGRHLQPHHGVFVGVISPIDPQIETPEEVRERFLEAAAAIPPDQLGTTDDCGFAPFSDDNSTSREKAFAKIRSRVEGTRLASESWGLR